VLPLSTPSLEDLGHALRRHSVTTLWLTAPMFDQMVETNLEGLQTLRQLIAGGDALSVAHVARAKAALKGCRLLNGYGPTENTTFTCTYEVEDAAALGARVPIGRPIANTRVYVLDAAMRLVPAGVPGELYAGGDGVALGYLNDPAMTSERFVRDPFSRGPTSRLYKTGDRVRHLPDGNLEFLGRIDDQVKVRGFRVEPGEVEHALRGHPAVQDAVVTKRIDALGGESLAAYVVSRGATEISVDDVRQFLQTVLPPHMVPSTFTLLDALPLKANGKVDRGALPAPVDQRLAFRSTMVEPRTPLEAQLTEMWSEILGVERIGVDDNFFHLGGHSLLAMRVISRVRGAFELELPLRTLFECPTIAGLARAIEDERRSGSRDAITPIASGSDPSDLGELTEGQVTALLSELLSERQPGPATDTAQADTDPRNHTERA
jgi:acyl carrier protein